MYYSIKCSLMALCLVFIASSSVHEPIFESACDGSKWPDLELFLPINLHNDYWKKYFFHSLFMFWPFKESKTKVLVLADEEVRSHPGMTHLQAYLSERSKLNHSDVNITVKFNPPSIYYGGGKFGQTGYDRQQYLMFYPENYTSSEFVGYVDTDAMFFTYVARTDLFEQGKPVIHGRSGPFGSSEDPAYISLWHKMTLSTFEILGIREPTRCMAYFPVIIKTKHLQELRLYLERKYSLPFYEIFMQFIAPRFYSQFNLFCTYLWAYHKEEYAWYIHELKPDWDYITPPAWSGQETNLSAFSEKMKYPKPRIALHAKYREKGDEIFGNPVMLQDIFALGICLSPPLPRGLPFCTIAQNYSTLLIDDYFRFETMSWNGVYSLQARLDAQNFRYRQIEHCHHDIPNIESWLSVPNLLNVAEGEVIRSAKTGRSIYLYTNHTLRRIPTWDTYLKMLLPESRGVSQRVFSLLVEGPELPAL